MTSKAIDSAHLLERFERLEEAYRCWRLVALLAGLLVVVALRSLKRSRSRPHLRSSEPADSCSSITLETTSLASAWLTTGRPLVFSTELDTP